MPILEKEGSLFDKVAQAGLWVFLLRILEKTLGFVRLIILARILAPNDFGLFGLSLLSLSVMETFSQTGFQTALIQKKEDISPYLDVAWTVSLIRGLALFAILFLLAPSIAVFFNASEASLVIRLIGLSIFLNGLTNVGVVYFQKDLDFKKQFLYQFSITISDFVVAILAAVILRNVWALVFGQLAGGLTGAVISYFIHPYRPKLSLNIGRVKELFDFGRWVVGSHILTFLITQGDDIFVGKMLGMVPLGFYQMAYKISNMPATEISHVVSKVTFPAYSRMQDNLLRLKESYTRVLQFTTFLSFPIAGLIFLLAHDFTRIFLGQKWMSIVPPMQILAVCGAIRSVGATIGPVFVSVGKPNLLTKLVFVKLLIMIILIYPLTQLFGIVGTSLALLGASLVSNPLADYKLIKLIDCSLLEFLSIIMLPFISVILMCFALMSIRVYFPINSILILISHLLLGVLIYLVIIELLGKVTGYSVKEIITNIFSSIKSHNLGV